MKIVKDPVLKTKNMSLILLSVCFAVVIWSAAMHFSFLEINAEYIISSRLRTKSLW
tara:strand:+ start:240 stop:407 length:168 start_codon:yes stop_codon:yes gene_type:complete